MSAGTVYRFAAIDPDMGAVAARGRVEHPDRRPAGQLGAHARPAAIERLVDRLAERQWPHPRQLPRGPRHDGGRRDAAGSDQLVRHRAPGDDHPDRVRRVRRVRLRVDRLQASPGPVHRHRRPARRPAPDRPRPAPPDVRQRCPLDDPVPRQDDHGVPRPRTSPGRPRPSGSATPRSRCRSRSS